MKQTIVIEVPEGKQAIWKDGKVVFEDIENNLPNTWKDFCKNYPIKMGEYLIDTSSQIIAPKWKARDMYGCQNVLPSNKAAKQHLALMKLHQLRDCYRQGWEPDLTVPKGIFAIFYLRGEYTVKESIYSSEFLTFQTRKIASKFLFNFRDLIEQAGDLI